MNKPESRMGELARKSAKSLETKLTWLIYFFERIFTNPTYKPSQTV